MLWLYITRYFSIRRMERELVDRHWQDCEAHYRQLAVSAEDFLRQARKSRKSSLDSV